MAFWDLTSFIKSYSHCSIVYIMTLSSGSSIDTTLITFTTATPSISVYTTDISKEGTYILKIIGTLNGYSISNSATFSLIVYDACTLSTISSTSISDYSYDISELTTDTIATLYWT